MVVRECAEIMNQLKPFSTVLLPKDWGKKYADCDLNIQSPINIETSRVINNSLLVPMEYINYEARPANDVWTVSNNGHTGMKKNNQAFCCSMCLRVTYL